MPFIPQSPPSSSTSTAASLLHGASSSAPKNVQEALAEQYAQPPKSVEPEKNWLEKWGIQIFSAIVAGLIGWFSAIISLKGDIASNTKDISVIKNELVFVHDNMTEIKGNIKDINSQAQDIAVIKIRLDNIEKKLLENEKSRKEKLDVTKTPN